MNERSFAPKDWGQQSGTPTTLNRTSLARMYRYFRPYWRQALLVVGCILLFAGFGVLSPLLIRELVDRALPQGDGLLLNWLVLGMIGLALVQGLIGVLNTWLNAQIGTGVMTDLRNQLFQHLQKLPISFYATTKTGDLLSRLNNDVNGLKQVVTDTFGAALSHLLTVAVMLGTMLALDWRLTVLSIVLLPLFILPTRRVGGMTYDVRKETQASFGLMTSFLQERLSISGVLLTKTFGRQQQESEQLAAINENLRELQIRGSMIGRWFFMFLTVIQTAGPALIYWWGGHMVIDQTITLGTVIAFTAYLNRLYTPVSALAGLRVNVLGSVALFERLFEYLDLEPAVADKPQAPPLGPVQGRVEFDRVSLRHGEREVLQEISFTIEPGQFVAVVGPSGAGKSSLSQLLLRLYDPSGGTVRIDGHDLREVQLQSIVDAVGVVMQESVLFHASILDNLRYGCPTATREQVVAAAQQAAIHERICSLPQGYDTMVGERGYKLSGGEKQRLAIARMILKQPKIVVLDEATSALDAHTEAEVQQALATAFPHSTTIVIAHRLSTVLAADRILVLADGRLVEEGSHERLLTDEGLYASLYKRQLG